MAQKTKQELKALMRANNRRPTVQTFDDLIDSFRDAGDQLSNDDIGDNEISLAKLSQAARDFIGSGGSVTNNPDDEDLETKAGSMRLKDRTALLNRRGYRIIRPDFDFTSISSDYADCIWEVRYEHTLGGMEISIPDNVTILINGGFLRNGKILKNHTLNIVNLSGGDFFEDILWAGRDLPTIGAITPKNPLIITEDAISAFDSTKKTYKAMVTVPAGRIAIGIVFLNSDSIVQDVTVSLGTATETRDFDNSTLANIDAESSTMTFFEAGVIHAIENSGCYLLEIDCSIADVAMKGIILRAPDEVSGVVEDYVSSTHCDPLSCLYEGKYYQTHTEMYTGDVYLSVNRKPTGVKLFSGNASRYGDRYHFSCAILSHPNGVVVLNAQRPSAQLRVRFIENGNYLSISEQFNFGHPTDSNFAYPNAVCLNDGRIFVVCRGQNDNYVNNAAISLMITGIDTGTPSAQIDLIASSRSWYPKRVQYYYNSSNEQHIIGVLWNRRTFDDGETNSDYLRWLDIAGAVYVVDEGGAQGKWWSIAGGSEATNNAALGTGLSPRFQGSEITSTPGSGGIQLLGGSDAQQRYLLDGFFNLSIWQPGSRYAPVFFLFVESPGILVNQFGLSYVRGCKYLNTVRTLSPTDFLTYPSGSNSYRLDARVRKISGTGSNPELAWVVSRRGMSQNYNDAIESANAYYDFGGDLGFDIFIMSNVFSSQPLFFKYDQIDVQHGYTVSLPGWTDGENRITYHERINQLHPTHQQAVNSEYYL